jgi:hypothetical protein
MAHAHGCVWIDHREARIFGVSTDEADEIVLHDLTAPAHIHRKADHVHQGKAGPDKTFLAQVAGKLAGFRGIMIVGPGTARTDLAGYLADSHPLIAKRVWGVEPADHPTYPQLIALARKYFRAADRMHG